jgi:hypothetical protein
MHVVNAALQGKADDVAAVNFELCRLEVIALRIAVEFDDYYLSRRCRDRTAARRSRWRRRILLARR